MKKLGRYDIIEELGRGGMGLVYKASDPTIGRLVALKVLNQAPSNDEATAQRLEMFMREARAAGRLSHQGIVGIYDAVEDPETHSSYIVMEFVPGRDLESLLQSGSQFEPDKALEIIRQLAEALDFAHGQNVIHRDLKPANIMLTEEGRAKIADFGIAKFSTRVGTLLTDSVVGTPSYMSPEQLKGFAADARSDLFSLGIIAYTMLAGRRPFEGDTAAVMFKIVNENPVWPSHLNPRLSESHDFIVLRCLAKDPHKRYATAQELMDDLGDIQDGRSPRSEKKVPISELRLPESGQMAEGPVGALPLIRKIRDLPSVVKTIAAVEAVLLKIRDMPNVVKTTAAMGAVLLLLGALLALEVRRSRHVGTAGKSQGGMKASASQGAPPSSKSSSEAGSPPVSSPSSSGPTPQTVDNSGIEKAKTAPASSASSPRSASAELGLSTHSHPAGARKASEKKPSSKLIHVVCRHELEEGMLTISSGSNLILSAHLRGKKKGGILGIKAMYAGTFTQSIALPVSAENISVHVVSANGALDLNDLISTTPFNGPSTTLLIVVGGDRLTLQWGGASSPKP